LSGGAVDKSRPPLYLIDYIDISSFFKPALFQKAAQIYASGHSLSEVALRLNVPKSSIRKTLVDGGLALRPHCKDASSASVGSVPYGYARITGVLVEDQKEQRIIQLMIHHWQSGRGFTDIARLLNSQKIRPRTAPQWDGGTVRKVILRHQKQKPIK
jgi:hypothetical protein